MNTYQRVLKRFNPDGISDRKLMEEALLEIILKLEPNLILLSDAYKYSHSELYPPKLTKMVSYLESRGGKFNETIFFGLQYILKKYLVGPVLSHDMVDEAEEKLNGKDGILGTGGLFSAEKWHHLVDKHGGYLPIRIKAVPEGSIIPVKNILMLIESIDDDFPWLVGFLETLLLQVWYPITVSTLSMELKKIVVEYFEKTGADPRLLPIISSFVVNNFGMRGVSSMESAAIGDAAHLIHSNGSDTINGSTLVKDFYHGEIMYGKSISASEHSIMTMSGEAGELGIMRRILENNPNGLIAMVIDSFDVFRNASQYIGVELKDLILSRNGVFVARLDSGDPKLTIKTIFNILFEKFDYTINTKGFKLLPPQLRVLQSDGMNLETIREIYEMLFEEKIAAENFVIGIGGKLLQAGIDRDTQNFAIKACYAIINGEEFEIVKSPKEMDSNGDINISFKKSKKGLMKLVKNDNNEYTTLLKTDYPLMFDEMKDELITVFEGGKLMVDHTFEEIRERAKK